MARRKGLRKNWRLEGPPKRPMFRCWRPLDGKKVWHNLEGAKDWETARHMRDAYFLSLLPMRPSLSKFTEISTGHPVTDEAQWTYGMDPVKGAIPQLPEGTPAAHIAAANAIANDEDAPISVYVEAYLKHSKLADRTQGKARKAIDDLIEWLKEDGTLPTFKSVAKRVPARYHHHVKRKIPHGATARTRIVPLQSYWKYVRRFQGLEIGNVWEGLSFKSDISEDRPFVDSEIETLFKGATGKWRELIPIMTFGALTGSRESEICRMTVADFKGDVLHIPGTKNETSDRLIPCHPMLKPMLSAMVFGKPSDDLIFAWGGAADAEHMAEYVSDDFGKFRILQGVHQEKKVRGSAVTFKSFRPWCTTTMALNMSPDISPEAQAQDIKGLKRRRYVSHRTGDVHDKHYIHFRPVDLQECCDALKLPAGASEVLASYIAGMSPRAA